MKKRHMVVALFAIVGLILVTSCATAPKNKATRNKELDRLLERAKNNQETLTFYGDAYNEDNAFSLVKTKNGQYDLVLPLKDCFLDIKCNEACDPAVKTGHSGNHLWFYLQKNGIPYEFDTNDWNKTTISVVEGLVSHGIPVAYTGK